MNHIVPMDLGPNALSLSYRSVTRNEHWRMFHAHQGLELLYIHEGSGVVTLERNRFPLRPGMLFCFQPYQLHKVEVPVQEESAYVRSNLTFDPRVAEPYTAPFPKLHHFFRQLWKGTLPQQVFDLAGDAVLPELFASFDQAAKQAGQELLEEERALFLLSLLRHLKLNVFPQTDSAANTADKTSLHIERMLDWIELNFRSPFELNRLADELHLSPYHISHLFKSQVGVTMSDFIAARRLREACALLANTDMQISDIGREIGGFSATYFCQMFKKHKGITPNAYRGTARRSYEG